MTSKYFNNYDHAIGVKLEKSGVTVDVEVGRYSEFVVPEGYVVSEYTRKRFPKFVATANAIDKPKADKTKSVSHSKASATKSASTPANREEDAEDKSSNKKTLSLKDAPK